METLDWIALLVYFGMILTLAWWVIRQNRDTADDLFNSIRVYSESQAEPQGPHAYFGGLVYRRMGETAKAREWLGRADTPSADVLDILRILER